MQSTMRCIVSLGMLLFELWELGEEDCQIAHERVEKWRSKRNMKRRYFPTNFILGQKVWAFDAVTASSREDKFKPFWKGPYILKEKISDSMWKVEEVTTRTQRGRRPVLIFHQDHLQHYLE